MTLAAQKRKLRIGDLLVENGVINEGQLQQALAEQKSSGRKLGQTLVQMQLVDEEVLLNILSDQLEIPYVRLRQFHFEQDVVRQLPEHLARRHRAIALSDHDGELLVGMSDPMDLFGYDQLTQALGRTFNMAVVRESELLEMLDVVYSNRDEISQFAEQLDDELSKDTVDLSALSVDTTDEEAPVVRLLQSVFEDAVAMRASDIHIEPDETVLRIRQRIDGQLHEQIIKERRVSAAVVLRLKLMCGLNISEKRLPQDGRFTMRVKGRSIDVRLSTMPVQHGEAVVMRLLDQSAGILNLDATGMPDPILHRFRHLIRRPHGLVLVTGPTGSGKTTTLYGALGELNDPGVKIITAEDPVEYRLPRLTQVQVNPRIDLEFSTVLRAALRQDPDIILVGEMRDHETAEIGLRAALTGHMVLSTLHTNDAVSSALRLIDMGVEPFLVASALTGVLAQRLIKRVCKNCHSEYLPTAQEQIWLDSIGPTSGATFLKGAGCYQCNNTGYRGRMGVFELLEFDDRELAALRRNDQAELFGLVSQDPRFRSLAACALDDALVGETSVDEVLRLATDLEFDEPGSALEA